MKIRPDSPEGLALIDRSVNLLAAYKGATLSFASLHKIFFPIQLGELSICIEVLCDKRVSVLEKQFFFEDGECGPLEIQAEYIKHYLLTGVLYHPLTRMEDEHADDHIFIEFLVR